MKQKLAMARALLHRPPLILPGRAGGRTRVVAATALRYNLALHSRWLYQGGRGCIAAGTAEIVQGDASQLPWEDNRFSVATTMGSFIGFPKPLESLNEMYRVLRPGGRAVVSIEINAEDGKDHSKEIKKYGMWVWTEDEVRAIMKEAGFSGISITYEKGPGMPKMMFACGVKQ